MKILRSLAFAYGRHNRSRKAAFAVRVAERTHAQTVLLVGVSGSQGPVDNIVERLIAKDFGFVVASGITATQGWLRYVVADGRRLPFPDKSFDLVYANAVIEHVGGEADQQRFADEMKRVGRTWILTTPNRWFPVEAHFHSLLTHWRADWAPRGTVTRLLGRRDLQRLVGTGSVRGLPVLSPTLIAYGSDGGALASSPAGQST